MPYLVMVWFLFASVTTAGIHYDLQAERQTVRLFEQTAYGYRVYYVKVDK